MRNFSIWNPHHRIIIDNSDVKVMMLTIFSHWYWGNDDILTVTSLDDGIIHYNYYDDCPNYRRKNDDDPDNVVLCVLPLLSVTVLLTWPALCVEGSGKYADIIDDSFFLLFPNDMMTPHSIDIKPVWWSDDDDEIIVMVLSTIIDDDVKWEEVTVEVTH